MQHLLRFALGPLALLAVLLYQQRADSGSHHPRAPAFAPYEYVVSAPRGIHDREYRARLQLHGITVVTAPAAGVSQAELTERGRHNAQVEDDLMASTGNARILHDLDEQARRDYRAHHPAAHGG